MEQPGSSPAGIKVLLVFKNPALRSSILEKLEAYYLGRLRLVTVATLAEAIELLESESGTCNLSLVEHEGAGVTLLKALLELEKNSVFGVITRQGDIQSSISNDERVLEVIDPSDTSSGLYRLLKKGAALNRLPAPDFKEREEFVSIGIGSLQGLTPLKSDIYSRIRKDHYVCVFRKGTIVEAADLKKFIESNKTEFHIKTGEIKDSLGQVAERLEGAATSDVSSSQARGEFVGAHALLHDVVGQLGFTAEAQKVAKSCVTMALKALGTRPKLSSILKDLRAKEGPYIAAHSFMLGNVACALAHRIGWSSSATFFKLSLAAFLHDISLKSETHARIHDLSSAMKEGLEGEDLRLVKLHPVQASEYSKQFAEIPSDVDIIISQHHESPDGTGFPRAMPGKLISPLSALFIIAQDLVSEVLRNPSIRFEEFFKTRQDQYQVGQFKKIITLILRADPD